MEQEAIKQLSLRLLLNAEPFGFGPTAAIAGFFPHLRGHFETIGYMGKKHTLDLQKDLPYDAIHDVSSTAKEERSEDYAEVFKNYDILFTAMDYKIAEEAQKAGLKVFYYDALTWYWPEIPESVKNSDMYIAQNFFGVEERLKEIFSKHSAAFTVPPITPNHSSVHDKSHILINLGGLQNPYWPVDDVIDYARTMIVSLKKSIPSSENIVIAGSKAVSDKLQDQGVITYSRKDIEDVLAHSKLAFMTPGLGNIYDAAAFDIPTIWLPPANDSQGQQLALIEEKGMSDGSLDWSKLIPGKTIDYKGDQACVLSQIATAAKEIVMNRNVQQSLSQLAENYYNSASLNNTGKTSKIIDCFGSGGEKDVARLVVQKAGEYAHG